MNRGIAASCSIAFICLLAVPVSIPAQSTIQATADRLSHFEKNIRPALAKYCVECHASQTEASGGLLLDSLAGWQRGGDSGPAIVPGQATASRLLKAIRYESPKLQMPPDKKLPADVIRAFEKWIDDGAIDPRVDEVKVADANERLRDSREHWAYQPIRSHEMARHAEGFRGSEIDYWINRRLSDEGIEAASQATQRDLVKRLHYDLTGLPPTLELLEQFSKANDFESAYCELVDRLLASPQFGEVFARHWMDVARYAESVTLRGLIFKEAWRYRDYLVRAFAEDRPFDQMIREQIAGDLLSSDDQQERWLQLVATSFLAMGNTNFEEQDKKQLDMDYVDEQLDTLGQAFLGQTLGCARCHDHKFDPIPTKDYYALAGIFKSAVALRHSNVSNWIDHPLPLPEAERIRFEKLEKDLQLVTKEIAVKKKQLAAFVKKEESKKVNAGGVAGADPKESPKSTSIKEKPPVSADAAIVESEMKTLENQQRELQQQVDVRPKYLAVIEENPPKDIAIHIRGDVHNLGPVVPRGFLTAFSIAQPFNIPEGSSGRLEFAQWLTARENPLTSRVYANRIWTWLMGQGLVDSVNNFGTTGTNPSHPELLDWLALELVNSGWSTKHVVRLIVLSDVYRRRFSPAGEIASARDPDNRLYWNGNHRRLTAEELRDSMLLASGELDSTVGGSLITNETKSDYGYRSLSTRRSLYQPVFRNALPQLFDAFDFASPSVSTGQRSRSTVATQALGLLNETWVHDRAKAMAVLVSSQHSQVDPAVWIRSVYARCYQRQPTAEELDICQQFFAHSDNQQHPQQLEFLIHSIFASIDFRYLH